MNQLDLHRSPKAERMRVAAVQDAPRFLNPSGTTELIIEWLRRAAQRDCHVVSFGETFLPGYPFWLSDTGAARFEDEAQKAAYQRYLDAAIDPDGPEIRAIAQVARELGIFIGLGIVERGRGEATGSVYASALCIHPQRGPAPTHRKLMPTHEERLVWSRGDAHGLRCHEFMGRQISILNCWENWMPLPRQALYAQGSELHLALWPGSVRNTESITRHVAREGRVFVVSAGGLLRPSDVPRDFPVYDRLPEQSAPYHSGGSAIAAPTGEWLRAPLDGEVGLVDAEIDFRQLERERQNFDPSGHYSRPELLSLHVDRRRPQGLVLKDGDTP